MGFLAAVLRSDIGRYGKVESVSSAGNRVRASRDNLIQQVLELWCEACSDKGRLWMTLRGYVLACPTAQRWCLRRGRCT